eukprot:12410111-Karenia_brevis.AAC.1
MCAEIAGGAVRETDHLALPIMIDTQHIHTLTLNTILQKKSASPLVGAYGCETSSPVSGFRV